MIVKCPKCSSRYRIDEEKFGKGEVQVRCSSCQTTFRVPGPVPAADDTAGKPETPPGEIRILVCDDAPFFRTMLTEILTDAGYAVEVSATGEEALAKIVEVRPSLLILDLQLPGISGFEVVKTIRGSESSKGLPILAMSAVYTDSADIMNLEDVGADDYIGKKFKPEHLVRRVRNLLKPRTEDW